MAAYQQILIAHIFLLPLKLLFLYYYTLLFLLFTWDGENKVGNSKEAEDHIHSGQRRQFVGTQLNFFSQKNHVIIQSSFNYY